jgi:hypothetical protein
LLLKPLRGADRDLAVSLQRTPELSSLVASLALTAYSEHEDGVNFRDITVQSDISPGLAPDDQLPHVGVSWTPDQWVVLKHRETLKNFLNARACVSNFVLMQMFQYSIEIVANLWGKFDASHPASRSATHLFGCGP